LALAAVPVAGLWLVVSLWLARRQRSSVPAEPPTLGSTVDAVR
jgi:hypothetical protein